MKSNNVLYKLLSPLAVGLFFIIFLPRVKGRGNIPKANAAVLAGNHLTVLDCFLVMSGTKRCIHFLAKSELFKFRITNWFFKNAGLIPVFRNGRDKRALESAVECLKNGALVGVFPEGTVNKGESGSLLPFKIGAVKMAQEAAAPIIPFTISGRYIPFCRSIEIVFHKPFYVGDGNLGEQNKILVKKVCNSLNDKKQ